VTATDRRRCRVAWLGSRRYPSVAERPAGDAEPGDELLTPIGADPIITSVHSLCCSSRMFTWITELEALSLAIAEADPRWNR